VLYHIIAPDPIILYSHKNWEKDEMSDDDEEDGDDW